MEEKIKIHIPKSVYNILIKDCEAFEFYKKDEITLNKNLFLTRLINNYYKIYQEKESELIKIVSSELECLKNKEEITMNLVNRLNKLKVASTDEKFSSIISLKPTKESAASLAYIEKYLINNISLSEFFRNLFTSYSLLPQDQREQIIFKEQYEKILKAIKQNKKIFFTTKKNSGNHESCPYDIVTSKEELHCYLLAKFNGNCRTYRLSRINDVTIINKQRELEEKDILMFDKMKKYGPEYLYENEESTVIIKLTTKGKKMYKSYYVHRPVVDFIDNDYYYFSCSHTQLAIYFQKFGKEAFVISPKELQMKFYNFYKTSLNSYNENNRKK